MSFVFDSFTASNGTSISARTGETGATWTIHPVFSTGTLVITDNRIRCGAVAFGVFYASGTPANADYDVLATLYCVTNAGTVGVRGRHDVTANTGYQLVYNGSAFQLQKIVAGATSTLGTYSRTLTATESCIINLRMRGTTISALIDGVSRISVTDTSISAAGRAVVISTTTTATTGVHIADVTANDSTDLTAGSPSVTVISSTSLQVTATAPFGGTAPYTYQWQRSTSSGSGFSNISGATTLTYTDTGLTQGTLYYYRLIVTDALSATATSAETSDRPYSVAAPDNASLYFSPNWLVESSSARTVNVGAYLKIAFTGTDLFINLDTSLLSGTNSDNPRLKWSVDNGAWQTSTLTNATNRITIGTGLANTAHTAEIYFDAELYTVNRWNPNSTPFNQLRVTAILYAGTLSAAATRPEITCFFGDSLTEGIASIGSTTASSASQSATVAYPGAVAVAMDSEYSVVGWASQGYSNAGNGNVPAFATAYASLWSGQAHDLSVYTRFVIYHGTSTNGSVSAAQVQTLLEALRTANPTAVIFQVLPMTALYQTAITNGFNDAVEAGLTDAHLITIPHPEGMTTTSGATRYTSDQIHYNAEGHARFGSQLATLIEEALAPAGGGAVGSRQLRRGR